MTADGSHFIGLDVGATKIAAALGRDDGTLLASERIATVREDPGALVDQLEGLSRRLGQGHASASGRLPTVGIGICGGVGRDGVVSAPIALGWPEPVDVARLLAARLATDVHIDNDVNAGALGEHAWGAGSGHDDFVYISVGTGIGAGLVLNGRLYRGSHAWAGEIGHMSVDVTGIHCPCGNRGCIETTAGGKLLARWVNEDLAASDGVPTSELHQVVREGGQVTAREIFAAALRDDEYARDVLDTVAHHLTAVIVNIVNLLDVSRVVLGGGMIGAGSPLFPAVEARIRTWKPFLDRGPDLLQPAALRENAGVVGALAVALTAERVRERSPTM